MNRSVVPAIGATGFAKVSINVADKAVELPIGPEITRVFSSGKVECLPAVQATGTIFEVSIVPLICAAAITVSLPICLPVYEKLKPPNPIARRPPKKFLLRSDFVPVRRSGDAVAIGRIVRNLLDNAIKYTSIGMAAVSISIEGDGDGESVVVIVSIADSGPAIPVAEPTRIFEEFYQRDNAECDRDKGVGHAIFKRLCELIGAEIRVESTTGHGTIFRVKLRGLLRDSSHATPVDVDESVGQGHRV